MMRKVTSWLLVFAIYLSFIAPANDRECTGFRKGYGSKDERCARRAEISAERRCRGCRNARKTAACGDRSAFGRRYQQPFETNPRDQAAGRRSDRFCQAYRHTARAKNRQQDSRQVSVGRDARPTERRYKQAITGGHSPLARWRGTARSRSERHIFAADGRRDVAGRGREIRARRIDAAGRGPLALAGHKDADVRYDKAFPDGDEIHRPRSRRNKIGDRPDTAKGCRLDVHNAAAKGRNDDPKWRHDAPRRVDVHFVRSGDQPGRRAELDQRFRPGAKKLSIRLATQEEIDKDGSISSITPNRPSRIVGWRFAP